ncbi:formate/nitrite transporter family protein [Staphylococcus saprophyticus]|uniref:Formate nitrite family transporter n=1 Tax=Staphylococcus saprophyticus TaxID=29385 RepID=A0A380HJV1_STASA|nr:MULTISPECIES: formate/nitrite transporter family protein [Staphylococcus]EHY93508.1 formate nitrite family transporter [Staphylococcus saprophyticus subsp. saprophyticus KACC 16562]KIJ87819.1 formate/nitrite transporter [Staphylococcus saprophyticus]MBF2751938.1 formate/nitrite transporter family protein [Staphylococcus saprophyticus]MBF2781821.1 formate/nitrite transporter family protein [Staphylococcus saprophyticus]MBN6091817.1 formate/nitrite transporter family protein [Staphylococcus s
MVDNGKSINDTYTSKETIENINNQVQMKEVMFSQTPERYALKSIMSGFLLAIVTVFMLGIKTQFAGTNEGLVNLMGAISFSLALVLIVLTNSELLTSNFMYLTVGWYYKIIGMNKALGIMLVCFLFNIIGGFILFALMKFTPIMTPEMISSLTSMVDGKTIDSSWYAILVKAIFCNFFINIGIYVSIQFKDGLSKAFFIACGVIVFVFMGYEHVVFNAGLYSGMVFYDFDAVAWLHVLKNIVCAFIGNFIGGGIFVGLVYAYLNGRRDSWHSKS